MPPAAGQSELRFRRLLSEFNLDALDASDNTVVGLWPDFTLAFLNPAWFRFAAANRGEPAISEQWRLGRSLLEAIPQPLHGFYQSRLTRALAEQRRWEQSYECSSDEVYRRFRLSAYPLRGSTGLLLVHALEISAPMAASPIIESYLSLGGLVTQCCHCRKFRRTTGKPSWDWVPEWINAFPLPAILSHGICEMCYAFYYTPQKLTGAEPQNFSAMEEF